LREILITLVFRQVVFEHKALFLEEMLTFRLAGALGFGGLGLSVEGAGLEAEG